MSVAHDLMKRIQEDLTRGSAELAYLGDTGKREFPIKSSEDLSRYADILRPAIDAALDKVHYYSMICIIFLGGLFVVAMVLAILANIKEWGWQSTAVIPGLGVSATWPIIKLFQLRKEELQLRLLPEFLPLLPQNKTVEIIDRFLKI